MMIKSLTTVLDEPSLVSYAILGYKTGYPSLDSNLGCISDSELVLIAAEIGNRISIAIISETEEKINIQ